MAIEAEFVYKDIMKYLWHKAYYKIFIAQNISLATLISVIISCLLLPDSVQYILFIGNQTASESPNVTEYCAPIVIGVKTENYHVFLLRHNKKKRQDAGRQGHYKGEAAGTFYRLLFGKWVRASCDACNY